VNEPDLKKAISNFKTGIAKFFDSTKPETGKGRVLIGRDTRITSPIINDLMKKAMQFSSTEILDFGLQTTPQIHYYGKRFFFLGLIAF